jgi:N-acetylglucosamine kinase-like BadF-type ATPase
MAKNYDYTIIGIDGGGTRTRGILRRRGKTIAQTNSGTTRIGAVGVGESSERLLNVIADLCTQSNIDSAELDAVVIGLAGVWLEEERKRSAQLIKTLARGRDIILNDLLVVSDAELALQGALEGKPGIVMIVGTGSIAVGKVSANKIVRCGGWGIELDDEGSGAWIGREGLTAVVRALDGRGKKTSLSKVLVEMNPYIDLSNPRTIVKAYSERAFEYHMLTPLVMKAAEEGDAVCEEIIQRAAYHLMELLEALKHDYKTKTIQVALMGGIIDADTMLSKMLIERINKHATFKLTKAKGNAEDGAITIGMKLIEEMS